MDVENIPYNLLINIGSFPLGVTRAPFTWDYYGVPFPMHFNAGFMGTKQDPITLTVSPVIGWSVADAKGEEGPAN